MRRLNYLLWWWVVQSDELAHRIEVTTVMLDPYTNTLLHTPTGLRIRFDEAENAPGPWQVHTFYIGPWGPKSRSASSSEGRLGR